MRPWAAARPPLAPSPLLMTSAPDAIRVSEALSGESTQEVGSDASNDAPMSSAPELEGSAPASPTAGGGELKDVTLRTAPTDPRFPTTNQFHKCIKERGEGSGDCKPYMRAYRSICPDEWISAWNELRESGGWFGKY